MMALRLQACLLKKWSHILIIFDGESPERTKYLEVFCLRFAGQGKQSSGRGMSFPLNFREIPGRPSQLCLFVTAPAEGQTAPGETLPKCTAQWHAFRIHLVMADFHGQTNKANPRIVSSLSPHLSLCVDGKLSNKLYMFVHLMLFWFCVLLVLHPSLKPFRFTNWLESKKTKRHRRSGCNELVAFKTKKWRWKV